VGTDALGSAGKTEERKLMARGGAKDKRVVCRINITGEREKSQITGATPAMAKETKGLWIVTRAFKRREGRES